MPKPIQFPSRPNFETKVIEIRDRMTTIGAAAIRMWSADPIQEWYLRRVGHPADGSSIVLMDLNDQRATNDPYTWGTRGHLNDASSRTFGIAHDYIYNHFDEIENGQVIDVEFILHETKQPKTTERNLHESLT
jgi:hypothetical protein